MTLIKSYEEELMQQAYKLIFRIETSLKYHAENTLKQNYGSNWKKKLFEPRDLKGAYYHEIVNYYGKYSPLTLIFSSNERNLLYSLIEIRNKIAHMTLISELELKHLKMCYKLVKTKLKKAIN